MLTLTSPLHALSKPNLHLAALFTVTILVKADCLHVVMLTPDVRDSAATLITVGTTSVLKTK